MPVSTPDRCPECGHAPLALGTQTACPQCGFPLDAATLVWRPRRPWRIYIAYAAAAIFSPWLARLLQVVLTHGRLPDITVIVGAAMSLIALSWALPRLRVLLSEGHRYAAITPAGIRARTPRGEHTVKWPDLRQVRIMLGIPIIERRSTPRPIALEWIFDHDAEAQHFVTAVQQAQERYTGPMLDAREGPEREIRLGAPE